MLTEDERKQTRPQAGEEDSYESNGNGNGNDAAVRPAGRSRSTRRSRKLGGILVGRTRSHVLDAQLDRLLHLLSALGPELIPISEVDVLCTRAAQMIAKGTGAGVVIWRVSPSRQEYEKLLPASERRFIAAGLHGLSDRLFTAVNVSVRETASAVLESEGEAGREPKGEFHLPTVASWYQGAPALLPSLSVLTPAADAAVGETLRAEGIGTIYSLPLLSGRRKLGTLDLYYKGEHEFTPGEQELLEAIAYQTANSMEYSSYQEQAGRKTAEALLLREVSQMINRSLELGDTLDAILISVRRLMYYDAAEISLMNPDGKALTRVVAHNLSGLTADSRDAHRLYPLDGPSITAQIVASRHPLLLGGPADEEYLLKLGYSAQSEPLRSYVGLPLLLGDTVVGALELGSVRARAFTEDDVRILGNIAEQAATAIENARLHENETQRNRELGLLQEISRNINASLDLNETLKTVLTSLSRLITSYAGEVTIYDSTRNVLVSHITTGTTSEDNLSAEYALDAPTYSGWLGRNLKPLLIRKPSERAQYGIVSTSSVRSFIGAPMLIGNRLVGTLEVSSEVDNTYDESDLNLLQVVASQAASAVENAQLYERTDERLTRRLSELTVLQRIGEEMNSTFDLNEIFQLVATEAAQATGAMFTIISEVDADNQLVFIRSFFGDLPVPKGTSVGIPMKEGLIGRSLEIRGPVLVDDVRRDPDYLEFMPEVRSELIVPINYVDEVVGFIDLNSSEVSAFDIEHVHFIEALANQAAIAIGNAKVYQEQMRQSELLGLRANQLNQVLEIGNSITPDRDLDDLMDQVANAISDTIGFRMVLVSLVEGEEGSYFMRRVASAGVPVVVFEQQRRRTVPVEETLRSYQERFRISRSYFLPFEDQGDLLSPTSSTVTLMDTSHSYKAGSWQPEDALFVPLYSTTGDLLGQISVDDPLSGQRPSRSMVEALEVFANQAANAVENAQLFRRYSERITELNALSSIGRDLAAQLDSDAMAEAVYRSLTPIMPIDAFHIALQEGDKMRTVLAVDMGERVLMPPLPITGTLSEAVLHDGEAVVINSQNDEVIESTVLVGSLTRPRSWLGVPLRVGDKTLGVLSVQQYGNYAYTNRDVQLLTTIANQLATALDNATLFERNRQRVGDLAQLNEIGSDLSAARDEARLYELAHSSAIKLFNADAFMVLRYEQGSGTLTPSFVRRAQDESDSSPQPHSLEMELAGVTLRTRRSLLIGNVTNPEELPLGLSGEQTPDSDMIPCSWLSVPLLSGNEVLGILVLQASAADSFTTEQVTLLTLFVNQFTTALENAFLFERDQQRISNLGILNQVAQEITANLNVSQIHSLLYKDTQLLFGNDSLSVAFYEQGSDKIDMVYVHERLGDTITPPYKASLHKSISGLVIKSGEPLLIGDAEDPEQNPMFGINARVGPKEKRTRSWMGVPLFRGGLVIGMINVQAYKVNAFNQEQLTLLSTLANQVATALQNASLFERNERRIAELDSLNNLSRILTTKLDAKDVAQAVYEQLNGSVPVDFYALSLYDEQASTIMPVLVLDDGKEVDSPPMPLSNRVTGYVIRTRQSLMIGDVENDVLPPNLEVVHLGGEKASRAWIGVPLLIGERVLGTLSVQSYQPNVYSQSDLNFVNTVASQTAIALENVSLFAQSQLRIDELDSLNELSRMLAASMHIDAVAVLVYEHMKRFMDFDIFMMGLFDDARNEISWPFALEQGERMEAPSIALGEGISSWVIENERPLVIGDLENANGLAATLIPIQYGSPQATRSWAGVPMMVGRRVIGILSLQSYKPNQYDEGNIRPLLSVANQAAIAIENARLFNQRERKIAELATINQMAQEISSSLQIDELLQVIYNQVTQVISTRNFFIALYEEKRQEIQFRFMREHGRPVPRAPRRLGPGFVSQIIETRQPLLINYDTARYAAEHGWDHIGDAAKSWLGVPMVLGDRVLGVIAVQSYEVENIYTDDDQALLSTVGSQAAIAIQNAHLFDEASRRIMMLNALNEIGRVLGAVLDEEAVFQKIYEHVSRFFDLSSFYIALYKREEGVIVYPFMVEDEVRIESEGQTTVLGEGLASYVIANRRPLLIDDLVSMNDQYESYHAARTGTHDERSWMGVPMFLGGEVIGLISVQSRNIGAYNQEDLQALGTLAGQAAVAIRNASLFDEIRKLNSTLESTVAERTEALARSNSQLTQEKDRLSHLYNISHQLSTNLDLEDILNRGLRLVSDAVGATRGSIMVVDPANNYLVYRASLGGRRVPAGGKQTPWKIGEGLSGWAVQSRTNVLLSDVRDDARWDRLTGWGDDVRSFMAVPLVTGSDVYGVINLSHQDVAYFSEDQLRLVSTVATEMAIAMHNAELYNLISEQADQLAGNLLVQEQETSKTRAILESIVDGVLVFDRNNTISLVNPAAEQILGVPASQLVGKQVPDDLREITNASPELLDLVTSVIRSAGEGTGGQTNLSRRRFNLSERIVNVNISPVTASSSDTMGIVAVLRDITREAEVEMEKSHFVSTVSHELRTPMTVIKGNTDLLLMGAAGVLSPMQQNIMLAVKRNAERMKTLTDDLLMVSRIETGKIAQSIDTKYYEAAEIVESTASNLRGLAEAKGQNLSVDVQPNLPEVKVDRARIEQVLTNLLTNAVKYTPNNGQIRVRCLLGSNGRSVQVDVQDNGIGISEKDQEKLFTSFFRTDNQQARIQEGTGLGLVIAKNLVEIQGGQMWLDSTLGAGTTFHFTMPAFVETLPNSQIEPPFEVAARQGNKKARILVVDDDPSVTDRLAAALEGAGYEVFKAYSGRGAIEIAAQELPDLITMDIIMPQMDGFETMRALSEDPNSAGIPVVIVSLVSEHEEGFALGAVDFLPKPVDQATLLRSIERVLIHPSADNPGRVLIIDDERDVVEGLEVALRSYGFDVTVAFSGEDGLRRVAQRRPDVILLDVRMPGVGGTQVLETLKHDESTRNIPVIMLTASVPLADARVHMLKLGAEELLTKPFSVGQIVDQIKKVLPLTATAAPDATREVSK